MDIAFRARTVAELVVLTTDLQPTAAERAEHRERRELRQYLTEWRLWGGGVMVCTAIWGAQSLLRQAVAAYWPAVPLAVWAVILVVVALERNPADKD